MSLRMYQPDGKIQGLPAGRGFRMFDTTGAAQSSGSGGSGSSVTYIFVAGENLGGHRLVEIAAGQAFYFDPTDENNVGRQVGITSGAALMGANVTVVMDGVVTGFSGSIVQDSIYFAGASGTLTTTVPTSGVDMRVGVAIDGDTLKLELSEPCVLI